MQLSFPEIVGISMAITVPLVSVLYFFFLPRSQSAQADMEERLWLRSSTEIQRMEEEIRELRRENQEFRDRLNDSEIGLMVLTVQLIESGQIPRWPPDMPQPKRGDGTTINIKTGGEITTGDIKDSTGLTLGDGSQSSVREYRDGE